jgi:hypothetical protein
MIELADDSFGHMVSPQDALLAELPTGEDPMQSPGITNVGNLTWEYHNLGTINGIPIADADQNLAIDRDDLVDAAFTLKGTPRSKVFWMSPDNEDSIKLYDELLERQSKGEIRIMEELKQYDTNKSAFMVWVRYDEVEWQLNPRFAYLREELK